MKQRLFLILAAALLALWGCNNGGTPDDGMTETIAFHEMKSAGYGDFPVDLSSSMEYVCLPVDKDSLFSQIDKAVYKDGKIYILDWRLRKIFVYNNRGEALSVLSKMGRGPGEYLQISDFDVDAELESLRPLVKDREHEDPNYELPSMCFSECDGTVFYHRPVDDNVYGLNALGEMERTYRFDFGRHTVPDDVKTAVERNLDKFEGYVTLIKSVYVHPDFIVGSVYDRGDMKDFIADREAGVAYMQDDRYSDMKLIGISGGMAVFWLVPGSDGVAGLLPEEVRGKYADGHDVIALLELSALEEILRKTI